MADVRVEDRGKYLSVAVSGQLNLSLAQSSLERIRVLLEPRRPARLLYDVRELELTATTEIADYAARFHAEIGPLVDRLAVVVADYQVLGRVEKIFSQLDQHRIFYDVSSAESWLNGIL